MEFQTRHYPHGRKRNPSLAQTKKDTPRSILLKVFFMLIGFLPISAISAFVVADIPMSLTAPYVVLPFIIVALLVGSLYPTIGEMALRGWIFGLVAVAIYDCSRAPFFLTVWDDFIPKIGSWIMAEEGNYSGLGYMWRYIGNGGGLGVAFSMIVSLLQIEKKYVGFSMLFGLVVFGCLIITIIISQEGSSRLFKITPISFLGGLIGHLVYGWALGALLQKTKTTPIFDGVTIHSRQKSPAGKVNKILRGIS